MREEILLRLSGVRGEEFNSFNKSQQTVVTSPRRRGPGKRSVAAMKYVFQVRKSEAFDLMSATKCTCLGAFHSAA